MVPHESLLITMQSIIDLISRNREWLFSGAGILVVSWFFNKVSRLYDWPSSRDYLRKLTDPTREQDHNSLQKVPTASVDNEGSSFEPERLKNVVTFYCESPLDPSLTQDEIKFLKIFSTLPRRAITMGYRVDYLYNLLLSEGVPQSTANIFVRNLYAKGYLSVYTTERGTKYYRLSDDGIRYIVAQRYVSLDNDVQDDIKSREEDGRGLA